MRLKRRPDLDDVRAQFEAWRTGPRTRGLPADLWRAAVELADRYRSSTICRQLGLNQSRFKRMRQTLSGLERDGFARGRGLRGGAPPGRCGGGRGRSASGDGAEVGLEQPGFLELPRVAIGVGEDIGRCLPPDTSDGEAQGHLGMENGAGARLTVFLARADPILVNAIWRLVLGDSTLGGTGR